MSTRLLLVHESPKVISLILNRNSTRLGRVRFTPPTVTTNTDDTIAYLHHIKVNHFYRNKEIGSFMLNHMNTYLKKNSKDLLRGILESWKIDFKTLEFVKLMRNI